MRQVVSVVPSMGVARRSPIVCSPWRYALCICTVVEVARDEDEHKEESEKNNPAEQRSREESSSKESKTCKVVLERYDIVEVVRDCAVLSIRRKRECGSGRRQERVTRDDGWARDHLNGECA